MLFSKKQISVFTVALIPLVLWIIQGVSMAISLSKQININEVVSIFVR